MQLQFSASNALNKWLKADLPRLPNELGKQAGVNKLSSDCHTLSWQVHIIDNQYQSAEKTLIICEASSRFTYFIPLNQTLMTIEELSERLAIDWQFAFVDALEAYALNSDAFDSNNLENYTFENNVLKDNGLISRGDIVALLSKLNDIEFKPHWVKNTDLSINGHISDAAQWITQTLDDRNLTRLSQPLALDIATYINSQTKSVKVDNKKQRFIPIERLLDYVQQMTNSNPPTDDMSNVIPFRRE